MKLLFYNKNSSSSQIEAVKKTTEDFLEKQIRGIRQKEFKIGETDLKLMGFHYISNIDHADILFPFKRLKRDSAITEENGMSIVPESISPYSQLPYNDFVFRFYP